MNRTAPVATQSPPAVRWTGRTRGGRFGNWWFLFLIRWLGLWPAYIWLVPVAAYFTVAARREYRSSREYLERILGPQRFWRWPWLVFRHFYSSGITLLDRLAVIMNQTPMQFDFEGEPEVQRAIDERRGVILLSGHTGSWEMGGHLLGRQGRTVNLVVLEREEQRIRQMFDEALRAKQFHILTATDDPLRSVAIAAALRRGEIVALHGDRALDNAATVRIRFLGRPAAFPVGPYFLAAATGAPVIHAFAVRERIRRYRFLCFPAQHVSAQRGPGQAAILRQSAENYVEHLTTVLKQYPFQWYNFFPFWNETDD